MCGNDTVRCRWAHEGNATVRWVHVRGQCDISSMGVHNGEMGVHNGEGNATCLMGGHNREMAGSRAADGSGSLSLSQFGLVRCLSLVFPRRRPPQIVFLIRGAPREIAPVLVTQKVLRMSFRGRTFCGTKYPVLARKVRKISRRNAESPQNVLPRPDFLRHKISRPSAESPQNVPSQRRKSSEYPSAAGLFEAQNIPSQRGKSAKYPVAT